MIKKGLAVFQNSLFVMVPLDASFRKCCFLAFLKDTLKAFDDFKDKQQKCIKQYFLICKSMYILKVYSIDYKLRQNPNVKKMSFGQNKRYKK